MATRLGVCIGKGGAECAIQSLSPEQRSILTELYIHGSSTAEAARRLGIPLGTVKSRTFYALRSLRDAVLRAE